MEDTSFKFSFVVHEGPIGINLHSVRNGKGTFVESFYRTVEGALLAAEKCEEIQIGDRLAFIDDVCVFSHELEETRDILLSRTGPYKVTVRRHQASITLVELSTDPRLTTWLDRYLEMYCLKAESGQVVSKIRLANFMRVLVVSGILLTFAQNDHSEASEDLRSVCCSCILYSIEQYPVVDIPESVVAIVRLLVQEAEVPFFQLLLGVECVLGLVQRDLERTLLLKFQACALKKQMLGWMSASPKFVPVSMNDILGREDLLAVYFLFLYSIGRQRYVRILLNILGRRAHGVTADTEGKVNELRSRIVLEAARDELLSAFYGSHIFEVVLSLLQGRQVTAALAGESGESGRPLDLLQRTLRGIVLPEGIALHRRARKKETPLNADKVGQQTAGVVRLLSFYATVTSEQTRQWEMIVEASLAASLQLSCSSQCSTDRVIAVDEKEKVSAGMLQFLVPADRMMEGEPQLFSFVVTQKDGSYIYGASLVTFTAEQANEKVLVKDAQVEDVLLGEEAVHSLFGEQLVDLSPLDSASAESDGACENHAVDDTFFGAILSKSQSSQTLSRVADGAGQLLRGIRQWGELALPPHISSVSSVSSLRSLSVSVSVSGASPSIIEPITPLTPSLWELGATLSSAWTRPSAQVKPPLQILEEIEASDEMCGLWGTEDGEIDEFDQSKPGRFNGVALLSARPAVQGLRKPLSALAPLLPSDGAYDATAAWPHIVSALTESEHIFSLLQSAHSTEDFNPEVIFETLSAQNLATIYLAMLLEYKIVLVSTHRRTASLLVGEWLRLAMRPLDWCHIYAPVAPPRLALELLQCPAPYVLGIARSTLRAARAVPPSDAVVVDLDANSVGAPADLMAMLPAARCLIAKLAPILQPHFATCDSISSPRTDLRGDLTHAEGPVGVCREFLSQALVSTNKCTTVLADGEELVVALDEKKFLKKSSQLMLRLNDREEEKHAVSFFLKQFMRAQSFSEYLLASIDTN